MKNIFYILIIILLLFSCTVKPKLFCDSELTFLKSDSLEIVNFNLKSNAHDIIEDIQNQTEKDLCNYDFFNSQIEIENEEIQFTILPIKACNQITHYNNVIGITINKANDVLIYSNGDSKVIKERDRLSEVISIETSKSIKTHPNRNKIIYELEYDTSTEESIIKKRILEVFQGILIYANSASQFKYKKDLCELNNLEISNLKKKYTGIIGFIDNVVVDQITND